MMHMMQGMMDGMNEKMEASTKRMENKLDEMNDAFRNDMRQMGHGLQAGIMAFASDEMWTAGKMAPPRAGTSELGGVQRLSGPRWGRVKTVQFGGCVGREA